ncbi:hypothetical protein QBZ16_000203 [Prototheca wickerhamii]|uniref:Major facilitator superfamily (MFS) profile domain-containing protein n=1 Tax=Prototheca wickerhamii TaxID=3111 RepID=A0AAD9IMU4_PROWI|nr:hypothetical protein QBZ16_000203 [Prototheca wickerhamii]
MVTWYFIYFSANGCIKPFLVLLYRSRGLREDQIGLLAALRPCIAFPAGAAWAYLADRRRWHRHILIFALVGATVFTLAQAAVRGVWATGAAVLLCEALGAPSGALIDAAVTATLARDPSQGEYGRVRLFGALGWGLAAAAGGLALSHLGWTPVFVAYAALMAALLWPSLAISFEDLTHRERDVEDTAALVAQGIPVGHLAAADKDAAESRPSTGLDLVRDPAVLLFLATVTVMGYAVGTIESFLFLLLDELGGPPLLAGLTLTLTCTAEPIVFYFAGALLRALGTTGSLHVIFAAFSVRLACYATLAAWPSPWLILPVELLHGITFGLTWTVGTAWAAANAPAHLRATVQSAFQGCYLGLGNGVGSLLGGQVYSRRGAPATFWAALAVLAGGWALTSAARLMLGRRRKGNGVAPVQGAEEGVRYARVEMVER